MIGTAIVVFVVLAAVDVHGSATHAIRPRHTVPLAHVVSSAVHFDVHHLLLSDVLAWAELGLASWRDATLLIIGRF